MSKPPPLKHLDHPTTTNTSASSSLSWKSVPLSATAKRLSKLLPWSAAPPSTSGTDTSLVSAQGKLSKQERQRQRATEREATRRQLLAKRQESDLLAAQVESPEQRARYGQGTPEWCREAVLLSLAQLDVKQDKAKEVIVRGRLHAKRNLSSHLAFVIVRQQLDTLQCVVSERASQVSLHMVRWIERIPLESVIFVRGLLVAPKTGEPVISASIHQLELRVSHLFVQTQPSVTLPFSVYEAYRDVQQEPEQRPMTPLSDEGDSEALSSDDQEPRLASLANRSPSLPASPPMSDGQYSDTHNATYEMIPAQRLTKRVRLQNRILDLRTPAAQAIFRIQSTVTTVFRANLVEKGFLETHTPKLQGGASESGSAVFHVDYFGRPASLAQSPQLYKQMCIAADMKRVFEVGPVFRAENSNTNRHLCEYTGLDLEMEIVHDYHEAMTLIDSMLKSVFKAVLHDRAGEIRAVQRQFTGTERPVILDETPVIDFVEGVRLLRESGWREESGEETSENEDLSTRTEFRLCQLVKEKTGADYFILDHFPASARPFYTHPHPTDPKLTNSFDIFLCGSEISSGGQRIHDAVVLEANINKAGMDVSSLQDYLEGFRLGCSPHAGCGIGLERLVTTFLGLGDVRWASLFYRDPRSLPARAGPPALRHPEADTLRAAAAADVAPNFALPQLIANYGNSSNTSWLDERFQVYRQPHSGAAVGYVPVGKFAIVVGDPLCDTSQYRSVIEDFLGHLNVRKQKLRPLWLLVSEQMEELLGSRWNWVTLSCIVEQRVPTEGRDAALKNSEMERKLRKAEREGLRIEEHAAGEKLSDAVKAECEDKVRLWQSHRKGQQMHLTALDLWQDEEHRTYYIARSQGQESKGPREIQALVVLAQLAPSHGLQVKWALDFPGATSGAMEFVLTHALRSLPTIPFTFGAAAASQLEVLHGMGTLKSGTLSKTFRAIADTAGLDRKRDFRHKFGVEDAKLYICFPRHGLRKGGIRAILKFFGE